MTTRIHRSLSPRSFALTALSCATLWASSAAAQPAPAETPTAPDPTVAPDTTVAPGPAVAPAPAPTSAVGPPPAAEEPAKPKSDKGKQKNGNGTANGKSGGSKAPSLDGGGKAPSIDGSGKASDSTKGAAAEPGKYGELEIHGRLFARAALSTREVAGASATVPTVRVNALDLSLDSARIGFQYHSPLKWLSAEMEYEMSGKAKLKDAYVRARKRFVTVKAGQFKVPISAIALEGAFSLPMVDRGLLHEFLTDVLQVGDRRMGLSVELHDRDAQTGLRPTLTLGAFQGSTFDQAEAFRDIEDETLGAQSFAARAEVHPGDFTFGLSFEHRIGPERALVVQTGETPELRRPRACEEACSAHYYTLGADAVLDMEFSGGGLRLWVDGLAGKSWFESPRKRLDPSRALDGSFPVFGSLRGIAAFRVGGTSRRDFYLEPYGMAGVLDPDLSYGRDHVTEWVLGVNVGRWKLAKVGLEGNLYRGAARLPEQLGGDPDRMSLMLQAALAF